VKNINRKKLVFSIITSGCLLASQWVNAHTDLQFSSIDESPQGNFSFKNFNNEAINHGCVNPITHASDLNVIASILIFPDGINSDITVDGVSSNKKLSTFVTNWGNPVKIIQNNNVFNRQEPIKGSLGNVVGYWAASTDNKGGIGTGLKGGRVALVPFRSVAVTFETTSCAKTVTFKVAIADICKLTNINGLSNQANVNLWTPAVGSIFDGAKGASEGYDSPATLTINRTSPLPASCNGQGVTVVVTPSATQLNRDMTIEINGTQAWPLP